MNDDLLIAALPLLAVLAIAAGFACMVALPDPHAGQTCVQSHYEYPGGDVCGEWTSKAAPKPAQAR